MGEKINLYKCLLGNPEGKGPFGRPWRRWEDNIRMDFKDMECGSVDRKGTSGGFL
jgi:hypothetical protein